MKLITDKRKDEIVDWIPAELTNDMSIGADAKILWIKLWNSNKGKTKTYKEWKPLIKGLATQFGVSPRTIEYWMAELRKTGWITTLGAKNCTNTLVHLTPMLVQKTASKQMQDFAHNTTLTTDREKSLPVINTNGLTIEETATTSGDTFNNGTSVSDSNCGDYNETELPW